MKKIFLFVLISSFTFSIKAQKGNELAETAPVLKKVLTLSMPSISAVNNPGTRGASVVWHPVLKKYYAAMAGNSKFPLAVFEAKGKRISPDTLTCQQDVRGLWYNPVSKTIQGNAYADGGWFEYKLGKTGLVTSSKIIKEGKNQPNDQCAGAYDVKSKRIIFLDQGSLVYEEFKKVDTSAWLEIKWESADEDEYMETDYYYGFEGTPEAYNSTSVVYTGMPGAEIGFLNVSNKEIGLYNIKTGYLTKILALPSDAPPVNETFNFAYANGLFWLFDIESRNWYGYK